VFTAHYDHLGGMGDKTAFPGCEAMPGEGLHECYDYGRALRDAPQPYSMAFMFMVRRSQGCLVQNTLASRLFRFKETSGLPVVNLDPGRNQDRQHNGELTLLFTPNRFFNAPANKRARHKITW